MKPYLTNYKIFFFIRTISKTKLLNKNYTNNIFFTLIFEIAPFITW